MSDELAREIINNTPLSAGDTIDNASPELAYVGDAYGRGDVSAAAVEYAQQLYNSGEPIPNPDSGSGGGGTSPTTEPEPEPDRSRLNATLESVSSPSPGGIVVYWSVTNEIASGSGTQKTGTVVIDLDGRPVEQQPVSVPAGGSQSGSVELMGVSSGSREVCVRLQ